jgi:hypothetical protein
MRSDHRLSAQCMGSPVILLEPPSMTEGSASMNMKRMGAIRLIIFERLVTTRRVVHALRTRSGPVRACFRAADLFICTEPTISAK